MTTTITQSPAYPSAAKGVKLTFTPGSGGNFLRMWCTDAPRGSKLFAQIQNASANRFQIHAGDFAIPFQFQADAPGKYVVKIREYVRGASTYGGAYAGDKRGFNTETAKPDSDPATETTATIVFGERLTAPVGVGRDTATLVLWVWDDTIRPTSIALHGEVSPAIISPSSDVAKTAALSVDPSTLANQPCATVLGSLDGVINDMIATMTLHFANASVHNAADTVNAIATDYKNPGSKPATPRSIAKIVSLLSAHMNNDARDGKGPSGSGPTTFHTHGGLPVNDGTNAPTVTSVADMAGSVVALADLWRAYEAHRVSTAVHSSADTTHALAALPPLLEVHRQFVTAAQKASPAPAPTENPGGTLLVNGSGFKKG